MEDASKSRIGTKRPRDVESVATERDITPSIVVHTQSNAGAEKAGQEEKKPRLKTPPKTSLSPEDEHRGETNESTDHNVDAEAILMRALEEAIERDAAAAKKAVVPMVVDEDDDYDESD